MSDFAWVSLYFAVYATYCAWARIEEARLHRIAVAIWGGAMDFALMLPGILHCYAKEAVFPPSIVGVFFLLGFFSLIKSLAQAHKVNFPDSNLSGRENRWLAIAGGGLVLLLVAPGFYWGLLWFEKYS